MKARLLSFVFLSLSVVALYAQKVECCVNPSTGAICKLWIEGDAKRMNWIVATDKSQYANVGEEYGWGLGYCNVTRDSAPECDETVKWAMPSSISDGGNDVVYDVGPVEVTVHRKRSGKELSEKYIFKNTLNCKIAVDSIGIFTPFCDNYPDAKTCISSRAHAHIWTAENGSYVNLVNMGAKAPYLGLAVVEGCIAGYDVCCKNSSNSRGIIALSPQRQVLLPGQSFSVSWTLFANSGWDDFFGRLVSLGSVCIRMDKYVYEVGETATMEILGPERKLENCKVSVGDKLLDVLTGGNGLRKVELVTDCPGEVRLDVSYGDGERTRADCLVLSSYDSVIDKRVKFIVEHQQMKSVADPRYGAFMVYDNELQRIYLNDTPNASPGDRCEGAERLGMGVLLAKHCLRYPDAGLVKSLVLYADFVRRGLQDSDFNTWRSMSHAWGYRVYNYPWIAEFYFLMYKLTGEKKYALYGYNTMRAMYRVFGHSRYPIGQPVRLSLECLSKAGLNAEYDSLLTDYKAVGESYIKTSLDYPRHEVNYEQSIVAPGVVFLEEMYLLTHEEKYLMEVKRQLPVLEAFNGQQPSYHLNDISLRHWDGYWFGKREMWGDTMPHYWSCVSGFAFYLYWECTGDASYRQRAERIVENNLCLFTEEGRGSCAYLYPDRVDGKRGKFYDPYANDQDWALSFYYNIKRK